MQSPQSLIITFLILSTFSLSLSSSSSSFAISASLPHRRLLTNPRNGRKAMSPPINTQPTHPNNSVDGYNNSPKLLAREFVRAHNQIRAKFGEPLMQWDRGLARYARRWASKRIYDCKLLHSPGSDYGENIFWGGDAHWTPSDVVKQWTDEYQFYNEAQNDCSPGQQCGHYTQIIWWDSVRVGCARQKCSNGGVFIICEYDPPGNFINERPFDRKPVPQRPLNSQQSQAADNRSPQTPSHSQTPMTMQLPFLGYLTDNKQSLQTSTHSPSTPMTPSSSSAGQPDNNQSPQTSSSSPPNMAEPSQSPPPATPSSTSSQ